MFDFTSFQLLPLICSLVMNTLVTWLVVHFFYYPKGRRRDYYFTFILLSVSIFMLIALLMRGSHDVGIGAALGLFAIFGIIRYRTESVPIREMTYLFFLVALSVLNGKCGETLSILEQLTINGIFLVCVWLCENFLTSSNVGCKYVKYDNIDLIKPERRLINTLIRKRIRAQHGGYYARFFYVERNRIFKELLFFAVRIRYGLAIRRVVNHG